MVGFASYMSAEGGLGADALAMAYFMYGGSVDATGSDAERERDRREQVLYISIAAGSASRTGV